jgi:hypothetical protein
MGISVPLDHVSTWNEVCDALFNSSQSDLEPSWGCGAECEVAPDLRGGVGMLCEELAWFTLARRAQEAQRN